MKLRAIVLALGLFALLSTAVGGYLQYYSAKQAAAKEIEKELAGASQALKDNVLDLISLNQSHVRILAGFEQIREAVLNNRDPEALSKANLILDHFAEDLVYEVGYLMDSSGDTVASSNRDQPDSFVGRNYAFRPYFMQAIQGRPVTYLAVGVTSGIRGLYFSHPVYGPGGSEPIGVAVIKVSTRDLDAELSRGRTGIALLVHTSGFVFVSSREDWTLNLLWRVLPEELSQIENTQQFGKGPWKWTGMEKKGSNHAVDALGEEYLIHKINLDNCPGWTVVFLCDAKAISGKFIDPLVGNTGYIALTLCFLVGGAVIILYVTAQRDIGNRKLAEEALREREQMLMGILASSPIGIVHSRGKILKWANRAWEEMFGFQSKQEYVELPTSIMYPSEAAYESVRSRLYDKVETEEVSETDASLVRKEGSVFDAHIRISLLDRTDPGKGTISAVADISNRKLMEDLLRESEEKYRVLVDKAQEGIVVAQDGILRFVNRGTLNIMGYSQQELVAKPFTEFIFSDDRELVLQRHLMRLRGEQIPTRYSFRVVTKGKLIRWVEIDSGMITWEGRPAALFFMTDVTERKQMEDELRQSEERHRSIVENSFDGIFIQEGSKIVFANSRLYTMLGYSPGELDGMDHWLIYHPDYHQITKQRAMARMRGEEVTPQYEVRLQPKNGSSFLGEIRARSITIRGEPGVQVWVRDISQQRRSQDVQRRLATAIEQAAEAIVITDTRGYIHYVNPAFEEITGYSSDEVIGENPRILQSGQHDPTFYKNLWDTIGRGDVWTGQFINRKKDGALYREDATISPVRDSSGKIVNYVAVKKDITREFQLQEQLLQAQKMEAVGTLAGGVAHDFNNLLQVVLGYAEFMLRTKKEGERDYADLQKIYQAGKRGTDLVQSLLMFSRRTKPKFQPVDLNHEIVQVKQLLSRTIPKTIKIDLRLSGDLESIQADPSQLGQILMNLGVNARDAMPNGGTLTIETAIRELDNDYCATHLEVTPGLYVVLSVSDTGEGMKKETLAHIFEPFFSTKEVGKGTGLGLATVYGIVKRHRGHIRCYSELGHGTTFRIYLPAIPAEKESATPEGETPIRGGSETILLVDDEQDVRELGAMLLNHFGYDVITAANGREALAIYQKDRARISMVILDLIMPEMDGRQCLKEILRVDPNATVVIASGYSEQGPGNGMQEQGARGFVEKPYDIRQLLEMVRDVLDADLSRVTNAG